MKITTQEKIVLSLNAINWMTMQLCKIHGNLEQIYTTTESVEEVKEVYDKQLAEAAKILGDLASDLAVFMNDRDCTSEVDECALGDSLEMIDGN